MLLRYFAAVAVSAGAMFAQGSGCAEVSCSGRTLQRGRPRRRPQCEQSGQVAAHVGLGQQVLWGERKHMIARAGGRGQEERIRHWDGSTGGHVAGGNVSCR